jgi:carboxyl-terminal processing protease
MDLYNRRIHGEMYSADSIKMNESLEYTTIGGRTVYGGGGIMPDIFIPVDTSGYTSYLYQLTNKNVIYQFALDYSNKNQDKLSAFSDYKLLYEYLKQQPLLYELAEYAESKGIRKRPTLMEISKGLIQRWLHAYIIRNFFDNDGFYPIFYQDDPALNKAVEVIDKGIWRPEVYDQHVESNSKDIALSSTYIYSIK